MCEAITEDGIENQPVKLAKTVRETGQKCVKCDNPGILITRIDDSFCKDCFQIYVIHKFRAAIGKTKLIRCGEQVIVAFSGGANSAALLHLIEHGKSERAHRKLRFVPTLIHVDECGILDITPDERKANRCQVIDLMKASGFPAYLTCLEQVLVMGGDETSSSVKHQPTDHPLARDVTEPQVWMVKPDSDGTDMPLPSTSQTERLKTLVNKIASLTGAQDLVRQLRNQLLVATARNLCITKVLTAESSTRMAVEILADVAQGRGSQVSLNTGFSDTRNGDVMIIRPVRDLNSKDLAMFNKLFNVKSVFIPTKASKTSLSSTIEKLTETFVMGLQADFPSTVSNIKRTSEKLGLANTETCPKCCLCMSPLDTRTGPSSALKAIEFSQKMSRSHPTEKKPTGGGDNCCRDKGDNSFQNNLMDCLCYGCRLSLHNYGDDLRRLPTFVRQRAVHMTQLDDIKQHISDFLLDEDNR
ncbi:unnamed protein product [Lymnaea stagnalis]|uniref:Cytoplasmic tRNA 2-thiolation protein 2 n=1 Tax=Lymnaea stagnalis TaxID=6523 RepID=A0AAV2HIR5_LYMST